MYQINLDQLEVKILLFAIPFILTCIIFEYKLFIKQVIAKNFNGIYVGVLVGTFNLIYYNQLGELLQNPPKWIFVIPVIALFLTVFYNFIKDKLETFKVLYDSMFRKSDDLSKDQKELHTDVKIQKGVQNRSSQLLARISTKLKEVTMTSQTLDLTVAEIQTTMGELKEDAKTVQIRLDNIEENQATMQTSIANIERLIQTLIDR